MRKINEIIIHCAATPEGVAFDWTDIDKWHLARGWSGIGYHYVITLEGNIQSGRDLNKIGAHAKGHNSNSIGICYIGGIDGNRKPKDTRTVKQKQSLIDLLSWLKIEHPEAVIFGHSEVSKKACPSFDARNEYKEI